MIAIDTNLIVRYLTNDDREQAAKARALVDAFETFVSTSVLLETAWVLQSVYQFAPARVAEALAAFAGLPGVKLETPETAARALAWARGPLDFADALHLASAADCEAFVSFDKRLVEAAKALGGVEVRSP
ncbi:MAG: type II toxin-antitoxin system VapC family toxin [Alphaproteobacteria bacterium]|nr:type II toxin-antitoxin system VapC family toxin [Alphaproteobacteria bacterium]